MGGGLLYRANNVCVSKNFAVVFSKLGKADPLKLGRLWGGAYAIGQIRHPGVGALWGALFAREMFGKCRGSKNLGPLVQNLGIWGQGCLIRELNIPHDILRISRIS